MSFREWNRKIKVAVKLSTRSPPYLLDISFRSFTVPSVITHIYISANNIIHRSQNNNNFLHFIRASWSAPAALSNIIPFLASFILFLNKSLRFTYCPCPALSLWSSIYALQMHNVNAYIFKTQQQIWISPHRKRKVCGKVNWLWDWIFDFRSKPINLSHPKVRMCRVVSDETNDLCGPIKTNPISLLWRCSKIHHFESRYSDYHQTNHLFNQMV